MLVGQSSGAALFAALKLARKLRTGTIVTIFPDFGDKYLSDQLVGRLARSDDGGQYEIFDLRFDGDQNQTRTACANESI